MSAPGLGRAVLELVAEADGFLKGLDQSDEAMEAFQKKAAKIGKDLEKIGSAAQTGGRALTVGLTLPIVAAASASVKAAMDFESSFAGVAKTVDGVTDKKGDLTDFGRELQQQFRDLAKEIPVSVNELNAIGETAGALGIPKQSITDFTKVMAQLGVTTNLTSEQAANAIARIQNIFGTAGQDTDRLASTLVALGNAGASTESEIVEMAQRIAGAGNTVGLSQAQVLSFASTLASVGINAEAGGSAISRIFLKMNDAVMSGGDELQEWARVAGVSADEFKKKFETDAAGATVMFVNGLKRLKGEGENTNATMEGLIGKNIILKDTLNRLAGSGELLADQLQLGNEAWRDNNALTEEARKRFETTESKVKLLWARIVDLGITIGNSLLPGIRTVTGWAERLLPVVDGMARYFGNLPGPVQAVALGLVGVVAAAGPVLWAFGSLLSAAGTIATAFGAGGVVTSAFGSLTSAFGFLAPVGATLSSVLTVLTGPVGWLIGAGAAILTLTDTWGDLFRIFRSGVTIVMNLATGIGRFVGFIAGWIADFTGLSSAIEIVGKVLSAVAKDIKTVLSWFGDLAEGVAAATDDVIGSANRIESPLAQLRDTVTGKGLNPKSAADWLSAPLDEVNQQLGLTTRRTTEAAGATKDHEGASKASAKQQRELEKASKAAAAALEKQRDAIRSLGVVTKNDLDDRLLKLQTTLIDATRAGVPWTATLKGALPIVEALAAEAREYGYELEGLAELLRMVRQEAALMSKVKPFDPAAWFGQGQMQRPRFDQIFGSSPDPFAALNLPKITQLVGPSSAEQMLKSFGRTFTDQLGPTLLAAFQGGGNPLVSVGSMGGQALGTSLVNNFGKNLTSMFGKTLGGVFSSLLPGVGALVGPLVGKLVDAFTGGAQANRLRDELKAKFGDAAGNGLAEAVSQLGNDALVQAAYKRFMTAGNKKDVEAAFKDLTAAMDSATGVLSKYGKTLDDLLTPQQRVAKSAKDLAADYDRLRGLGMSAADATATIGDELSQLILDAQAANTTLPASMAPMMAELARGGLLSEELRNSLLGVTNPLPWRQMQADAEALGISVEDLGNGFKQARLDEQVADVVSKMDRLKANGVDVGVIMAGSKDEIVKLVTEAKEAGLELPASLKGWVTEMDAAGQLVDENGDKLEGIGDLKWAEEPVDQTQDLIAAMRELIETITGPDGLAAAFGGIRYPSPGGYTIPDPTGGGSTNPQYDPPQMARGGIVMPRRGGTLVNVGEAGRPEAIIPLSGAAGLRPLILKIKETEIARALFSPLAEEFIRAGVVPA